MKVNDLVSILSENSNFQWRKEKMTVSELISELSQIKDKDQIVYSDAGDEIEEVIQQNDGVILF